MKQHPMPVLTEQQREDLRSYLSGSQEFFITEVAELEKLRDQIVMAALTAEPKLWSYWFNSNLHYQEARFGRPKLKNGKKVEDTFYTAPPLPVMNPIERPAKCPAYRDVRGSTYPQGYDDGVRDSMALVRLAGYEVKE